MKNINTSFYARFSTQFGHITFAILTLMAFLFFKERTVILDACFQSSTVLRNNDFGISADRFGAAMTQIFPLVALRLGGSLATILLSYSLGFVLVHWGMFWLCDKVLKQKEIAFAIVLFSVFMVNNTFYWAQNEAVQGISLNFVFWAMLIRRGSLAALRWFDYPLLLAILVTIVYFHPLLLFVFGFITAYFFLEKLDKSSRQALSFPLISAVFIGFIGITYFKNTITPNGYDTNTSTRIKLNETLLSFVLRITEVPSFKDLSANMWTDFGLLPLSILALTVFYVVKKRFLKLALVWVSVLAYTLIILISYREGGSWFHIESQYLPMSIFVIVPLVWELIPELINPNNPIINALIKSNSALIKASNVLLKHNKALINSNNIVINNADLIKNNNSLINSENNLINNNNSEINSENNLINNDNLESNTENTLINNDNLVINSTNNLINNNSEINSNNNLINSEINYNKALISTNLALITANDLVISNNSALINVNNVLINSTNTPSVLTPIKAKKRLIIMTTIIGLAILFRLIDIFQTHYFYTARFNYIGELLEKTKRFNTNKFAIEEKDFNKKPLMQTWAFVYETIYYSALKSPDSLRSIIVFTNPQDTIGQLNPDKTLKKSYQPIDYNGLNRRLFNQLDTAGYLLLKEGDLK